MRTSSGSVPILLVLTAVTCAVGCTTPRPTTQPHPAAPAFSFRPLPCDTLPTARDTVTDTLYMTVSAPVHARPLPPQYVDRLLDALQQSFIIPHPVAMPVFVGPGSLSDTGSSQPTGLRPGVAAEAEFTLGDTAAIVGRVSTSSLSPVFDRALADAPRRADSLHLISPLWDPWNPGGPVKFYVSVVSMRPRPGSAWAPLLVVRIPQWREGRSARPVSGDATSSPLPSPVHGAVHDEDVVMQVVIDESGQPVLSTVRLLEAHYREFARAAINRLESTSYHSASIGACAVKGIAELRYSFAVGGKG